MNDIRAYKGMQEVIEEFLDLTIKSVKDTSVRGADISDLLGTAMKLYKTRLALIEDDLRTWINEREQEVREEMLKQQLEFNLPPNCTLLNKITKTLEEER